MGHVGIWLHDHHWRIKKYAKATWGIDLVLVALLVFVVIMLLFPSATY